MFKFPLFVSAASSAAAMVFVGHAEAAIFASGDVASQTSGLASPYDNPGAALGPPSPITGVGSAFPSVLSPFNPAYEAKDIVEIGSGGQLTLQFPNVVKVGGGSEIGVISNNFLIDADGNGDNTNPAGVFGSNTPGGGSAQVLVSDDGVNFKSIGTHVFNEPANYFLDAVSPYQATAGSKVADFGVPFVHPLSDFNGLNWTQTLALLGSSGGGTWLDLAPSGHSQVDYIQFRVPAGGELVIDAVSINNNDVGAAVPEPGGLALLAALFPLLRRPRR